MRWAILTLCLCACGSSDSEDVLRDARDAVRQSGEELLRIHDLIVTLCMEQPTTPTPEVCVELVDSFNKLQKTYSVINESIP